ncbi:TPA: hypothetical protein ACPKAL_003627 [Vibrio alginolyticus]|uniref:hypothetical protein n=1 Tax=Vibrio alginolyticus TaxID=663 RepID=UPI00063DD099|nr:hypothetical protein [Vibrio alginolyticus]HCG5484273.1 hypothetical protein [Vibrio parahaemolyticus]KLI71217.1 hypothetical protein AAW26_17040 [Vibrio alginolyticus]MDM4739710.1 hypothetical protein [Vibrio alginolyticus]MDM4760059.1 hypothetical protein [Vibrio alginolyticus]HCG6701292.1 hypothetical protein [Vibrio parahaemolyticus]
MAFIHNEHSRKSALITEIGCDIERYENEIKVATESKKKLNSKIDKLIEERNAAERRIEIASSAKQALEQVIEGIDDQEIMKNEEVSDEQDESR